jgi:hypothetical protein
MPRKPKPSPDDPEQFKRFIDMAREVEADESPDAVDRALRRVIQPKRLPNKPQSTEKG